MTPTLTAPDPAIFPADVLAFAAERGVTDYLVPLYDLARQCFPGADVAVGLNFDWDIADLGWIVYEVPAGPMAEGPRQIARSHWRDEKLRMLPRSASGSFVLRVR